VANETPACAHARARARAHTHICIYSITSHVPM
jgi:hypothetical protein